MSGSVYLKELPAAGLEDDALFDVIEKVNYSHQTVLPQYISGKIAILCSIMVILYDCDPQPSNLNS